MTDDAFEIVADDRAIGRPPLSRLVPGTLTVGLIGFVAAVFAESLAWNVLGALGASTTVAVSNPALYVVAAVVFTAARVAAKHLGWRLADYLFLTPAERAVRDSPPFED